MNGFILTALMISAFSAGAMPTGAFDPRPYIEARSRGVEASELRRALESLLSYLQSERPKLHDTREMIELLKNTQAFPALDDEIPSPAQLENELLRAGLEFNIHNLERSRGGIVVAVGSFLLERYKDQWILRGQSDKTLDEAIASDVIGRATIRPSSFGYKKDELYEISTSAGLKRLGQILNAIFPPRAFCEEFL